MNSKIAIIFLIVLAVALKSSQGKGIHDLKDDIDDAKKAVVVKKLAVAKGVGAKIKLVALKKLAAAKAVAKAPFVLGKKAALLKIAALKSLAAYKAAKLKKALDFAGKKTHPASTIVAGLPAIAGLPSFAALPSFAGLSSLPSLPTIFQTKPVPHPEVVDIYSYPSQEQEYHIPANTVYYKTDLEDSRSYVNDYSLISEANKGSQYYPISDIIQPHETYGVPAN